MIQLTIDILGLSNFLISNMFFHVVYQVCDE